MPTRITGTIYSLRTQALEPLEPVILTHFYDRIPRSGVYKGHFVLAPGPTDITVFQLERGISWSITGKPNARGVNVNILKGERHPGGKMRVTGSDASMEASVDGFGKIRAERY